MAVCPCKQRVSRWRRHDDPKPVARPHAPTPRPKAHAWARVGPHVVGGGAAHVVADEIKLVGMVSLAPRGRGAVKQPVEEADEGWPEQWAEHEVGEPSEWERIGERCVRHVPPVLRQATRIGDDLWQAGRPQPHRQDARGPSPVGDGHAACASQRAPSHHEPADAFLLEHRLHVVGRPLGEAQPTVDRPATPARERERNHLDVPLLGRCPRELSDELPSDERWPVREGSNGALVSKERGEMRGRSERERERASERDEKACQGAVMTAGCAPPATMTTTRALRWQDPVTKYSTTRLPSRETAHFPPSATIVAGSGGAGSRRLQMHVPNATPAAMAAPAPSASHRTAGISTPTQAG